MELAALSGLMAIGYAVSQLASPSKPVLQQQKEGFHTLGLGILPQSTPPSEPAVPFPSQYYTVGLQQYLTKEESSKISELNDRLNSLSAAGSTDGVQAIKAQIQTILGKGATRRSQANGDEPSKAASNTAMAGTTLDMMYRTPGGQTYPSEPNAGPQYGGPISYATGMPPMRKQGQGQGQGPMPEPIESATPLVQMVSSGVEASAAWTQGDTVISALTGQPVENFKHNNMQPFFGGRVKQNM